MTDAEQADLIKFKQVIQRLYEIDSDQESRFRDKDVLRDLTPRVTDGDQRITSLLMASTLKVPIKSTGVFEKMLLDTFK